VTARPSLLAVGELAVKRFGRAGRAVLAVLLVALVVANALNIGADLVAIGSGMQLLRAGTGVALLPVPAGTRNHFAKDVGNGTIEQAAAGTAGRRLEVDLGDVNGRCFVNNSSIGLYPQIVVRREARERRVPKWVANTIAVYEQLRHGRRLKVDLDGEIHWAWMAFVGNGRYGDGLLDLADRESVTENLLDVRIVKADRPLARLRVVLALLLGRLARSPLVYTMRTRRVSLDVDRDSLEVALDGEVETLATPLIYESQARALTILVAAGDLTDTVVP
jgi:diacylglycerol kinase family enzyme